MSSTNNFMNTSTHPSNNYSSTTDTTGPHNSNVANKLDPRVDSDRDGRAGGLGGNSNSHTAGGFGSQHQPGATSAYGTSTTAGPHNSNVANKMDPRVDSDRDGRATHGTTTGAYGTHSTSTNTGPHNSNVANKMDPRVDSDRDGRAAHHNTSTNAGPHNSNITNKMDPRVDSDRDGRGAHGTHSATTGGALGSTTQNNGRAQDAGPHDSKLANKLDPRVKTDKDGRAHGRGPTDDTYLSKGKTHTNVLGNESQTTAPARDHKESAGVFGATTHANQGTTSTTHNTHGSTNAGPHNSNAANKMDPRVDSDRDHTGTNTLGKVPMVDNKGHSTASHARTTPTSKSNLPGPAPNTAGPHKSDILNKLDPRVDSNLDGSKTIGGNKTHAA